MTQLLIELHTSNPANGGMLKTVVKVFLLRLDDIYRVTSVESNTSCPARVLCDEVSQAGHIIRPGGLLFTCHAAYVSRNGADTSLYIAMVNGCKQLG